MGRERRSSLPDEDSSTAATAVEESLNHQDVDMEEGQEDLEPNCPTISSGCTVLNCAMSDSPKGGLGIGKIVNLIGDSSTGKTLMALTMLAELANNPEYDNYSLVYDDVEAALEFDISGLFGRKALRRIEPPRMVDDETWGASDTIQDFYGNVYKFIQRGEPFIYVLDSFDALTSKEEKVRAASYAKEAEKLESGAEDEKKEKESGSYKMEKAKLASEILRVMARDIKELNAVVIIISQTRDNIDPQSYQKKTRSGGRALKFYSSHEIWLSVVKSLTKKVGSDKPKTIGSHVLAHVTKNKLTGKKRKVEFLVFDDIGIDDVGSNIDFLVAEGYWKKSGQTIKAVDLGIEGTRSSIITQIESGNMERNLVRAVGKAWLDIEEKLKLNRKPRFA